MSRVSRDIRFVLNLTVAVSKSAKLGPCCIPVSKVLQQVLSALFHVSSGFVTQSCLVWVPQMTVVMASLWMNLIPI